MSTPRDRVDTLRERARESDDIAPGDGDLLIEFSDRLDLLAQTYSDYRHEKLLRHCVIMAERLDDGLLAEALEDQRAAERIVAWINRTYDNEETNRDYRSALRVFGKRVAGRHGVVGELVLGDGDDVFAVAFADGRNEDRAGSLDPQEDVNTLERDSDGDAFPGRA